MELESSIVTCNLKNLNTTEDEPSDKRCRMHCGNDVINPSLIKARKK